jgi:hypothetical protein
MGWLFSDRWPTRGDLIKHLVQDNEESKTLRYCCVGNNLWMVREIRLIDNTTKRLIILCMMQRRASDLHDMKWGYKDVDETAGPTAVTCPLSYIEMCTEPMNEYSRTWRERVRRHHALRNRKLKVGDKFSYCGSQWQVCDTHGMHGWSITELPHQGLVYRFHRRQMAGVTDIVKCQT